MLMVQGLGFIGLLGQPGVRHGHHTATWGQSRATVQLNIPNVLTLKEALLVRLFYIGFNFQVTDFCMVTIKSSDSLSALGFSDYVSLD